MTVLSGGEIVLGGTSAHVDALGNTVLDFALVKYTATGALDTASAQLDGILIDDLGGADDEISPLLCRVMARSSRRDTLI